ncbi:DUF2714 domain-containing protein [Metamycoplasma phocicerebrale]|uniref:DUF2714 domain-containing protein n=1 Tax=Metamycoplasma phocicerebrale TaxID=142649 RepID=A0A3Q9V917_9BACT|nr:DUF2714 domain-containing protein [Metamycoplasma phocicerebrale]AZZ65402.1 DUF2714 domain-containing protein [Metamycoplasma phocicerebrale]
MLKNTDLELKSNKDDILFWLEKKLTKGNFINFDKLLSTVLLTNSLTKDNKDFVSFLNKINNALKNFEKIDFINFAIDFQNDKKFSISKKVPVINFNLKNVLSTTGFENFYNLEIDNLLENYYVEFLPNIVLYKTKDSSNFRIYIMSSYFKNMVKGEKNAN